MSVAFSVDESRIACTLGVRHPLRAANDPLAHRIPQQPHRARQSPSHSSAPAGPRPAAGCTSRSKAPAAASAPRGRESTRSSRAAAPRGPASVPGRTYGSRRRCAPAAPSCRCRHRQHQHRIVEVARCFAVDGHNRQRAKVPSALGARLFPLSLWKCSRASRECEGIGFSTAALIHSKQRRVLRSPPARSPGTRGWQVVLADHAHDHAERVRRSQHLDHAPLRARPERGSLVISTSTASPSIQSCRPALSGASCSSCHRRWWVCASSPGTRCGVFLCCAHDLRALESGPPAAPAAPRHWQFVQRSHIVRACNRCCTECRAPRRHSTTPVSHKTGYAARVRSERSLPP